MLFNNQAYSLDPFGDPFTFDSPLSTVGSLREVVANHLGYGPGQHKQFVVVGKGRGT